MAQTQAERVEQARRAVNARWAKAEPGAGTTLCRYMANVRWERWRENPTPIVRSKETVPRKKHPKPPQPESISRQNEGTVA